MKKLLLGLGAAAVIALTGQAFLATPADAAKKEKYCVWHEGDLGFESVLVTSADVTIDDVNNGWDNDVDGATGSLAAHLDHGDTWVKDAPPDFDCTNEAGPDLA
jgi:hypothetical protein